MSSRYYWQNRLRPTARPRLESLEGRQLLATFVVNSAADTQGVPGSFTLRDAIIASNTNPLNETNLIKFAIGAGAQTITLLQPLPPVTQPVIIDGTSQGGYAGKPLITLTPGAAFPGDALDVYAGFTQIRGFNIQGFKGNGIVLAANGSDQVQDCYIGTSLAGTSAAPNTGNGVLVSGSSTNTITNDIVSGNGGDGIQIADNNTTLFLGQNFVWEVPPNTRVIGGNTSYTPYSIPLMLSGQGYTFTLPATPAPVVSLTFSADGALTGSCALPTINATLTGPGGPSTVTIAGTPPESPAIVSGTWDPTSGQVNGSFAIQEPVTGVGTNGEFGYFGVVGGKVSLDSTLSGTYQVSQGDPFGRITFLAKGISDVVNNAEQNSISGNYIGTNASGANLGNTGNGVNITDASNSTIGGTATGAGNVISGNSGNGIDILSDGNFVQGNKIGTNAAGTAALGNVLDGIHLNDASNNRIIGNVVSDNGFGQNGINQDAAGINLESKDLNNIIAGNKIGTNAAGDAMLGNSLHGIFLGNGSSNNTIGGPTDNDRNVISGNGQFPVADFATQGGVGVYIFGANTSGNVVQRNYIGTNAAGTDALTNSVIGVLISQSFGNTVQGNLISGNRFVGLEIAGGTASGNLVQGNLIGTNAGGTRAIPNGLDGITINNAPNNSIGGTTAGAGNLISGNGSVGIQLFGTLTQRNVIEGNALGLDSAGRPTLPNRAGGIFVNTGLLTNQVGGTAPDQANRGQARQQFTVTGFHQSHAGSKTRHSPPAGRRFHIRGSRTAVLKHGTH